MTVNLRRLQALLLLFAFEKDHGHEAAAERAQRNYFDFLYRKWGTQ
jgi:hypothetical protein